VPGGHAPSSQCEISVWMQWSDTNQTEGAFDMTNHTNSPATQAA